MNLRTLSLAERLSSYKYHYNVKLLLHKFMVGKREVFEVFGFELEQ